ncbi:MAG: hypothetical protein F6K30_16270 [Cyanothece sp. SIO2G6]|nr:hypothetical protein [Cyanothece sp. SIO2G6]
MARTRPTKRQLEGLLVTALYGATWWGILSSRTPFNWVLTVASGITAECVRHSSGRDRLDCLGDAFGAIGGISGDVETGIRPYTNGIAQTKTQIISHALKQLPMGESLQQRFLDRQGVNTDWFEGFEKRCAVLVGESKDGKTFLLKWRLQRFIEQHPDGHEYYIGDIDYGRCHEGDTPNTWFDSPVGQAVFTTADDIAAKVRAIAQDIRDGHDAAVPTLIILDELVDTMEDMDRDQFEQFMRDLKTIKNRGLKAGNITFVLGLHSTTVGETGIPQWLLRGVETIWLYRAGQERANFLHLNGKNIDECPKQLARLPRSFNGLRPCIVYSDKKLSVKAIPTLDFGNIEVKYSTVELSAIQQWEQDHWTPEKELTVLQKMREREASGKTPYSNRDIMPIIGIRQNQCVRSNEVYEHAKSLILALWESSKKSEG